MNKVQRINKEEKSLSIRNALTEQKLPRAAEDVDKVIYQNAESKTRSEEDEINLQLKISNFFLLHPTVLISNYRHTMSFLSVYNKK